MARMKAGTYIGGMNHFVFNKHGACLNPKRVIDWGNKVCRFIVEISLSPNGQWNCGTDITVLADSSFRGACLCRDTSRGYPSERHAVTVGLERCRDFASKELHERTLMPDNPERRTLSNVSAIPYIKAAIKRLDGYIEHYTPNQLF